MVIRQMQGRDVDAAAALEREIFSKPWSKKSFQDALQSEYTIYLVAEDNMGIIGYCGIWLSSETGDLCNMAVLPSCRRQGIGRKLLEKAIHIAAGRGAEEIFLEVRESNLAAFTLYEKLGFQKVGIRKGYYHAPTEDAIVMRYGIAGG